MKKKLSVILTVCFVSFASAKQPEPPVPNAIVFNTFDTKYGVFLTNLNIGIYDVPFNIYFHSEKNNEWLKNEKGALKTKKDEIPECGNDKLSYILPPNWRGYDYFAIEILPMTLTKKNTKVSKSDKNDLKASTPIVSILGIGIHKKGYAKSFAMAEEVFEVPEDLLGSEVQLEFDYNVDNYGRFIDGTKGACTLQIGNARLKNEGESVSTVTYFGKEANMIISKIKGSSISGDCRLVLSNPGDEGGEYKFWGCNKKTKDWAEFSSATSDGDGDLAFADEIPFKELKDCICFVLEKDGVACDAKYEIDSANKKVILTIQ